MIIEVRQFFRATLLFGATPPHAPDVKVAPAAERLLRILRLLQESTASAFVRPGCRADLGFSNRCAPSGRAHSPSVSGA
jgi:hypothetical protein